MLHGCTAWEGTAYTGLSCASKLLKAITTSGSAVERSRQKGESSRRAIILLALESSRGFFTKLNELRVLQSGRSFRQVFVIGLHCSPAANRRISNWIAAQQIRRCDQSGLNLRSIDEGLSCQVSEKLQRVVCNWLADYAIFSDRRQRRDLITASTCKVPPECTTVVGEATERFSSTGARAGRVNAKYCHQKACKYMTWCFLQFRLPDKSSPHREQQQTTNRIRNGLTVQVRRSIKARRSELLMSEELSRHITSLGHRSFLLNLFSV